MQHKRRIAIAAAVVAAAAAALPAAGFADRPLFHDHESFVDPPSPGDWCGAVNGTWSDSGTFTFRQDVSGAFHATQVERSVFTADATGNSIEVKSAGVDMGIGIGIDNGDGTTTFTEHTAGLAVTFRIPGGPLLKDADGKPLLGAGVIDSAVTFDDTTGDIVSGSETFHGPHPGRDGVDVCTPTIAYLTS